LPFCWPHPLPPRAFAPNNDDCHDCASCTADAAPAYTTIGDGAFEECPLTSVTLGSSVTTIGAGTFAFTDLTSMIIPESVTIIGSTAFYHPPLASVTLGSSVASIGTDAFYKTDLTSIEIFPKFDSITLIGFREVIGQCGVGEVSETGIDSRATGVASIRVCGRDLTSKPTGQPTGQPTSVPTGQLTVKTARQKTVEHTVKVSEHIKRVKSAVSYPRSTVPSSAASKGKKSTEKIVKKKKNE
jgi:hypothetical protein